MRENKKINLFFFFKEEEEKKKGRVDHLASKAAGRLKCDTQEARSWALVPLTKLLPETLAPTPHTHPIILSTLLPAGDSRAQPQRFIQMSTRFHSTRNERLFERGGGWSWEGT